MRYTGIPLLAVTLTTGLIHVGAVEPTKAVSEKFLGSSSCSSTSCHGGAGDKNNQNLIWSKLDFHSRSYATLTSARSERFAEILKLGDATKSQRCTTCHAPFHCVEETNRMVTAKATQGVSCEACHGPAEQWLRSHTRPDFTRVDRAAAGMRDLKDLYVRANTCVACHQTVDSDIAAAGHPDLLFELDGQSVSEPKHWRDVDVKTKGPQSWLIGQAVALREMSWQLSSEAKPNENQLTRWSGLLWVLKQVGELEPGFPNLETVDASSGPVNFNEARKTSDALARRVAEMTWTDETTRKCLARLAQRASEFENQKIAGNIQARRAERLVVALDRLIVRIDETEATKLDPVIRGLFKSVQSIPDFEPESFAKQMAQLSIQLGF